MSIGTDRTLGRAPAMPISGIGAGIALSLAVHAGVAALMVALLHAHRIADQPIPKSRIRIETQVVEQSKARQQSTKGAEAKTDSATGTLAAQGVVQSSRAKPVPLPQTRIRSAPAPATQLLAAKPRSKALMPEHHATALPAVSANGQVAVATTPTTTTVSATAVKGEPLAQPAPPPVQVATTPTSETLAPTSNATLVAASPLPSIAAQSTVPPAETIKATTKATTLAAAPAQGTVTAAAKPAPFRVAALAASGKAAAPVATAGEALTAAHHDTAIAAAPSAGNRVPPSRPHPQSVSAAPTAGERMTATLAWSGSGGVTDPVSLKAIASFMRPQSAAAQADGVHDGISSLLSSVPCARMQAEFDPKTGSLDLRGHVPDPTMKAPLVAALQAQVGSGIKVKDALMILPRPQCGALTGIAAVGLPQSQDQLTNPRLIGPDAQARTFSYVKGQAMVLDLTAPKYAAYIYVDYFDAGGNVIHLIPNDRVPLKLHKANSTLHVGAGGPNTPHLSITVGPPYGQEIAVAFAASDPLYHGVRPLREPAGPYLAWLKKRVATARAKDPNFKGEWVYFMVRTRAK